MDTQISKYLSLKEATKSDAAIRHGIPNQPDAETLERMKYVATNIFDKVRDHVGAQLGATSFYRCKELNDVIGGSSATSQHMSGEAIDIDCDVYGNGSNIDVFFFIKNNLVFDQVIMEYPDAEGHPAWVHVSMVNHPKKNRGQVLVKLKAKYIPFGEYKIGMV